MIEDVILLMWISFGFGFILAVLIIKTIMFKKTKNQNVN